MLRNCIGKQVTKAISIEKRVAITLWTLATSCEYRTVAHLFGVGRSAVCFIVNETCNAIVKVLMPLYIKFPSGHEIRRIVYGFETKWGFQQCVSAIDGSHIPISVPTNNHTDFYNRKGWYFMIVQAIC